MHAHMCNRHTCPLTSSRPHLNHSENPRTSWVFFLCGLWGGKVNQTLSSHLTNTGGRCQVLKPLNCFQKRTLSKCSSVVFVDAPLMCNGEGKDHFVCYWAKHQLTGHLGAELSPRFKVQPAFQSKHVKCSPFIALF